MTHEIVPDTQPSRRHGAATRRLSQPHEPHEREAERAAGVVASGGSVADWSFGSLPVGRSQVARPGLQRRCSGGGQRCGCNACAGGIDGVLAEPGAPLDVTSRSLMETRFGHDFSRVRVHAGASAAESARAVDAAAFTVGNHVVAPQALTVATAAGRHLLAHELAHVVQGHGSETGPTVHRQAAPGTAHPGPATAPPAPSRPQREERLGIGRGGGRVDAELDRASGWLTVKMKVLFNFVNAPRAWPSVSSQNAWRDDFIRAVTRRWSFKHLLVPATQCAGEPQLVAVRLQVIPVAASPHFTMSVGFTDQFVQSSVGGRAATMDSLDVAQRSDQPQTPVEHEFGHMLGLPHIHCDANDQQCYGVTREERADVMGQGSFVSPRDYEPFAELMPYFTGCNWRVRQASFIPTSRGPLIGGLIGGLLGGAGGAALGFLAGGPVGAVIGAIAGIVGGALLGSRLGTPDVPS